MCSLVGKERYKPFFFKCPWLGKISFSNSPVGFKWLKLSGLVLFSCLLPHPIYPGTLLTSYNPASIPEGNNLICGVNYILTRNKTYFT